MKILVCDKTETEAIERMRAAGLTVDTNFEITPEELPTVLPAYDGMVVRSRTKVRQPLIDVCPNLEGDRAGWCRPRYDRRRICPFQGYHRDEHPQGQFRFGGGAHNRIYVHTGALHLQGDYDHEGREMGKESL